MDFLYECENRRTLFGASSTVEQTIFRYFEYLLQEIAIYKSEKRIFLPILPRAHAFVRFPVILSIHRFLFHSSLCTCTPFYTLLLSICLPDSMQIGSDSKLMRVTGEEDIFVRNNAP